MKSTASQPKFRRNADKAYSKTDTEVAPSSGSNLGGTTVGHLPEEKDPFTDGEFFVDRRCGLFLTVSTATDHQATTHNISLVLVGNLGDSHL
jgi:hypothetical protein